MTTVKGDSGGTDDEWNRWKFWIGLGAGLVGGWLAWSWPGWSAAYQGKYWWDVAGVIATFAAAVSALGIAIFQHTASAAARRREPLYALRTIIDRARFLIDRIPHSGTTDIYVESFFKVEASVAPLEELRRSLQAFPLEKLFDYAAIGSVFEMQDALENAIGALRYILPFDNNWADKWAHVQGQIARATEQADLAAAQLQTAIDGAGFRAHA